MTIELDPREVRDSALTQRQTELDEFISKRGKKHLKQLPPTVRNAVAENLLAVEQIEDLDTLFNAVDTSEEVRTIEGEEVGTVVLFKKDPGLPMLVRADSNGDKPTGDKELDAVNKQYKKLKAEPFFDSMVEKYKAGTVDKSVAPLPQAEAEMRAADALKRRLVAARIAQFVEPIIAVTKLPHRVSGDAQSLGRQALKPTEAPLPRKITPHG